MDKARPYNMVKAISSNGGITLCAVDSTDIVRKMEQLHQTSAVVTAALGRLLTAASVIGSQLKNRQDSLTLRINGGGPAGTLLTVSDGEGNVRGYAENKIVELPFRNDGKLDVGAAVGRAGVLAVIRDLGMKEPYIGQTPLVSGEIAEDITAYYTASEQTPSACALGVLVNPDLTVKSAGGFLLQLLPGASEAEAGMIEENIARVPQISRFLDEGNTLEALVETILQGFGPQVIEKRNVGYRCKCSRKRSEAILLSLGRDELTRMQREDPAANMECHFCGRHFTFNIDDLLARLPQ